MPGMRHEMLQPMPRVKQETDRRSRHKKSGRGLWWAAAFMIWGIFICGAYLLADMYIGEIYNQLEQIERTNSEHVEALNARLAELQARMEEHQTQAERLNEQFAAVQSDLEAVKEEMSLAGNTLNTSTETKQALSERINDLSKELEELRKLIRKLEEAARVY